MAEDKKKDEIAVIEINEEFMKQKLYEFRGCKVLLDADLAEVYGYAYPYTSARSASNNTLHPRNSYNFCFINSSLISITAISSFFLSSAMELLHPFAVKKIVRNSHMNILLTSAICPICYYCSIISVNHFLFHIKLSPPTLNHFTDASKMVYSSFSLSLS